MYLYPVKMNQLLVANMVGVQFFVSTLCIIFAPNNYEFD